MIYQSFKMAWASIVENKMRSFLTMLGIIIGVMALVVLVSLVDGATGSIESAVSSLASDMLSVTITDDKGVPIRLSDLEEIKGLDEVENVSPAGSTMGSAVYQGTQTTVSMYGVTPAYYDIEGLTLGSGRFLKTADVDNQSYVVVLSYGVAEDLFGEGNPLGCKITIKGYPFTVVGVLSEEESMMAQLMGSGSVYVPYTVESRLAGEPYITSLAISGTVSTDEAETAVEAWLLERFHQDEDSFRISNMSSISDTMSSINDVLELLLGGIAAISLLVGGIGIMNIMLVSVTERTREIGIRKAIGAGHRSIMIQFLLEALMVSLFGCIFGLILSALILAVVSIIAGSITFTMAPNVVVVAVLFSSGIGLLFGLYPAQKAAKKHPIEALHYEG